MRDSRHQRADQVLQRAMSVMEAAQQLRRELARSHPTPLVTGDQEARRPLPLG